jgi:ferrous iron transport protein A
VSPETLLPLEYLTPGEWGEVAEVSGEPTWVGRLAELGIRAGCRLRMLRGGSPCLVQVGGGRLSLRGDGGMQVLVRPVNEAGDR